MKLGETVKDSSLVGTRDAIHQPLIIAKVSDEPCGAWRPDPGDKVWFVDKDFTTVSYTGEGPYHGIVDPFEEYDWGNDINTKEHFVIVLLRPGSVSHVTHTFEPEIPKVPDEEMKKLKADLAFAKAADPECAECWKIEDGKVTRD